MIASDALSGPLPFFTSSIKPSQAAWGGPAITRRPISTSLNRELTPSVQRMNVSPACTKWASETSTSTIGYMPTARASTNLAPAGPPAGAGVRWSSVNWSIT